MKSKKNVFDNRVNSFYLQPELLSYIDDNTLKLYLGELLGILDKTEGFMKTYYLQLNQMIFCDPIFVHFYRSNLLYLHFYETACNWSDHRYRVSLQEYNKKVSKLDKIKIWGWRKFLSPYTYFIKELRYN